MIEVPFAGDFVLPPPRLPLDHILDTATLTLVDPTGPMEITAQHVRLVRHPRGWITVFIGRLVLPDAEWRRVVDYFGRQVPSLRGSDRGITQELLGWTLRNFVLADVGDASGVLVSATSAQQFIRVGVIFYGDDKE